MTEILSNHEDDLENGLEMEQLQEFAIKVFGEDGFEEIKGFDFWDLFGAVYAELLRQGEDPDKVLKIQEILKK